MSDNDVLKMKVADLKRELKVRGLSTTGNKNELQERLQTALLDGDLALDDAGIAEDLLDDALTDEDDKEALDLSNEDVVLQSPDKEEEEKILDEPSPTQQQKKVILKRKNSITMAAPTTPTDSNLPLFSSSDLPPEKIMKITSDTEKPTEIDSKDADEKKVIKLSQLSTKDRLEMRAKKFGITTAAGTETAKLARAERFGQPAVKLAPGESSNETTNAPPTSIDVLKKRAERFGYSVSSRMTDLEKKEKLQKRQERFGAAAASLSSQITAATKTVPEANGSSSAITGDYAEKAKQRLERFKTAVK